MNTQNEYGNKINRDLVKYKNNTCSIESTLN